MLFFWLISVVNEACISTTKNMCSLGKQKNEPFPQGAFNSSRKYNTYIITLKRVQRSKWSQSQGLLLIGEIRESFMEEVTFNLAVRRHFKKRKGQSIGSEAASTGNSEESVSPSMYAIWRAMG